MQRFSSHLGRGIRTLVVGLMLPFPTWGGGVTLITHGFLHRVEDWVAPMGIAAARHPRGQHEFGPEGPMVYVLRFDTDRTLKANQLQGPAWTNNPSGDVILLLDWNPYSGDLNPFSPPAENTTVVGPLVADQLLSPTLLPGFPGPITRLPLHLIGFSRGGSLVCEISKRLGEHQIVVDHLSLLDPHASNNDGFDDPLPMVDGTVVSGVHENVLFADCVFQTSLFPKGSSAQGAYIRSLNAWGVEGWDEYLLPHDNAHLWYHGTVEVSFPVTSDGKVSITADTRAKWYAPAEDQGRKAGYYYSLRAGGDRREVFEPVDAASGFPRLGLNALWGDVLRIPTGTNRAAIATRLPEDRPNIIEFNLTGPRLQELTPTPFAYGAPIKVVVQDQQSGHLTGRLTYLLGGTNSATLTLFVDSDANSFNGRSNELRLNLPPTGTLPSAVELDLGSLQQGLGVGVYNLGAVIGLAGMTREYYAPERLQVTEPLRRPWLGSPTLPPGGGSVPRLEIVVPRSGNYVLESSGDLNQWTKVWEGRLEEGQTGGDPIREAVNRLGPPGQTPRFFRVRSLD